MKDSKENPPWDDHVIIDNGMIMFNGSKRSDAGNYMCVARTEDEEINATIKVEVYSKLSFCDPHKNIKQNKNNKDIKCLAIPNR